MRCPSEQLCAVSAADRGADVQFAPEGFAPRWSLPSPFHGEEAKLPKGCGAFRTADQTISSLCGAYALPAESIHIASQVERRSGVGLQDDAYERIMAELQAGER
jgi:putative intracellular protease/amidase